jgi:hypothetical protein
LNQYHDFFENRPLEEIQDMINNYTIQGELWKSTPRYIWITSAMC